MIIQTAEELFAPVGLDKFIDVYLEKRVLHLERDNPALVENLFDLDTIESCLRYDQPWHRKSVRVVPKRAEEGAPPNAGTSVESLPTMSTPQAQQVLLQAISEGATLILNSAHEYAPGVARIIDSLIDQLACSAKCNVYFTPAETQGFDTHVDGHDVLVLQTYGSKTWRIHETANELPLESSETAGMMYPRLEASRSGYGESTREVTLHPGDLLYLPRGAPHSAIALAEPSIHFTIGLYPLRWHEMLKELVDLVSMHEVDFRRRVSRQICIGQEAPPSAGDLLRGIADVADSLDEPVDVDLLVKLHTDFTKEKAMIKGRVSSALLAGQINVNTVVARPDGAVFEVVSKGEELLVRCRETMSLPLKLKHIMPFLEQNSSYRVGDLPKALSENAKIVLTRNMVKNGLLIITEIGDESEQISSEAQPSQAVTDFLELTNPLGGAMQPS